MLGLKLPTDPRWVNIVEKNIEDILVDHAWCEQKAATNAVTLIVQYPHLTDMVIELTKIVQEEIEHFDMVHKKILERKLELGREQKDPYVKDLIKYIRRGGSYEEILVDKLMFAAMIEARSCERFRLLSLEINDDDLKSFYHELMISEAGHYSTFIGFARQYGKGIDVDKRWQEFLDYEASIIVNYGTKETVHG